MHTYIKQETMLSDCHQELVQLYQKVSIHVQKPNIKNEPQIAFFGMTVVKKPHNQPADGDHTLNWRQLAPN